MFLFICFEFFVRPFLVNIYNERPPDQLRSLRTRRRISTIRNNIKLTFSTQCKRPNGSFVGSAGVRCYFLGFWFLVEWKNLYMRKKRVYERNSNANLTRENEWNRLWCMCWTVKQAIMTFVNLFCSGKLIRSVNSHSVLFFCLLDFDYVFFSQFTLRSMIGCNGIHFFGFIIVWWMRIAWGGIFDIFISHQSQPISKSIIKCFGG